MKTLTANRTPVRSRGTPSFSNIYLYALFVRVGRIALQAIDDPGLGRAELHPVARLPLQLLEELPAAVEVQRVELFLALELDLESELADQRPVLAARPPQRHVAHRAEAVAEIELADVLQHLL